MTYIRIPVIDANIRDVSVVAWRRKIGEEMLAGEALVDLATDKSVFVFDAPVSGTLLAVFAGVGSVVPIRYAIGAIGEANEPIPGEPEENAILMHQYRQEADMGIAKVVSSGVSRVRATPRARRLAAQHGLDLAAIAARCGLQVIDEAAVNAAIAESEKK